MTAQRTVDVGNAIILLTAPNDPFSDGHTTGYLEFYDERHRPAFLLTSQTICEHLEALWNEPQSAALRRNLPSDQAFGLLPSAPPQGFQLHFDPD